MRGRLARRVFGMALCDHGDWLCGVGGVLRPRRLAAPPGGLSATAGFADDSRRARAGFLVAVLLLLVFLIWVDSVSNRATRCCSVRFGSAAWRAPVAVGALPTFFMAGRGAAAGVAPQGGGILRTRRPRRLQLPAHVRRGVRGGAEADRSLHWRGRLCCGFQSPAGIAVGGGLRDRDAVGPAAG